MKSKTSQFTPRHSLQRPLLIAMVAIVILAVVPLVIVNSIISARSYRQQVMREMSNTAALQATQIESWIDERLDDIRTISGDMILRERVAELRKITDTDIGPDTDAKILQSAPYSELLGLFSLVKDKSEPYKEITLLDARYGRVFFSTQSGVRGKQYYDMAAFQTVVAQGKAVITKAHNVSWAGEREPEIDMLQPMINPPVPGGANTQETTSVLVIHVSIESLLAPLIQGRVGMGQTGEVVLVNSEGIALIDLRYIPDSAMKYKNTAEPARRAATGETGIVETLDYRGVPVLAAYQYIPSVDWGLVAKMDSTEVFAPYNEATRLNYSWGALSMSLAIAAAWWFSRRIIKPVRELHHGSEVIATGHLEHRLNIHTGDELEQLAVAFNDMASKLQESYSGLEQKVAVRTRSLTALRKISDAVSSTLTLDAILPQALTAVTENLKLEPKGGIFVLDTQRGELVLKAHLGLKPEFVEEESHVKVGECLCGQVAQSGQLLFSGDSSHDIRHTRQNPDEPHGHIIIPLKTADGTKGVMFLYPQLGYHPSDEDIQTLTSIGSLIGIAIANSQLYQDVTLKSGEATNRARDLEVTSQKLEASNREMESMLYSISHDLRAPLISIRGFAVMLSREYGKTLDDTAGFYMTRIEKNLQNMESLINEILELSRIGRLVEPWETVDTLDLVHEIVEELEPQLKEAGAEVFIAGDMPRIRCERKRLRQVFANLIDNARKFMGSQEHPRIEVGFEPVKGVWHFYVRDNGMGIATEEQKKVFKLFQTLGRAKEKEGSGVGLAIVRRVVESHGGQVWVESEGLGKGSAFHFTISGQAK